MGRSCPLCGKTQQNLSSHLSRIHNANGETRKFWLQRERHSQPNRSQVSHESAPPSKNCGHFQLQHPFTAMVAGMTGSGKTVWVQNLLEHAQNVIQPPPRRIVWCYSQWQPTYDKMMQTVQGIEFVKGIPQDLDEDWYFDSDVTNMIVIDDQMSETSKDKRIMNLFTKGSHHRNLSVIFILQNLFHQGKITRTMSLNSHYLVLFKNPRDKLQILTLGKQMYPGKTEQFIQKYETAVQRPYGYLFVDLKPNTPDECRLRTNVLPNDQTPSQAPSPSTRSNDISTGMQAMANYFGKQGYMQPPILNAMHHLTEQMQNILSQPVLQDEVKAKEYSQVLERFLDLQHQIPYSSHNSANMRATQPLTPSKSPQQPTVSTLPSTLTLDTTPKKPSPLVQQQHQKPQPQKSPAASSQTQLMTPSYFIESTKSASPTPFNTPLPETPKTSLTPLAAFPPTPPTTLPKQKWFSYVDSNQEKDKGPLLKEMEKVRRSKRLRAMAKLSPHWNNF